MGSVSNDQQLHLLLKLICESVNTETQLNSKLLRDILDVVEGLMREALNSKGKYDHSSLKLNCNFISNSVAHLQKETAGRKVLKLTHREHAIPLRVVLRELYKLKNINPDVLKEYFERYLVSVLITKDEQKLLDSSEHKIKDKMPPEWDGKDVFARFLKVGIKIQERHSNQFAA